MSKILSEATILRLAKKAMRKSVKEAKGELKRKFEKEEAINNIIESVIPSRYSGYRRDRMKSRVRESLRNNHKL